MRDTLENLRKKLLEEPYLKKLGIVLKELKEGYASFEMKVTEDVMNIHGIAHGGAIFSLMDAAFEASSNSHGVPAVALSMNIMFHKAPKAGDTLVAESKEIDRKKRVAFYAIEARSSEGELIATCQALVYRKIDK